MELFYSRDIAQGGTVLPADESNHCVRVLRHRAGDRIDVVDGTGNRYLCEIEEADPRGVRFRILERQEGFGSHPYHLQMAVAPPKNIDRFEWFAEKATEIGVDIITPLFGENSERKVFKPERVERILVSAAKQSHKGAIPSLEPAVTVKEFLSAHANDAALRCICYCDDTASLGVEKRPLTEVLREAAPQHPVILMIGPEGDFSRAEIAQAVASGWLPVSLGESRLRIETAAIAATAAVYFAFGA